MRSRRGKRAFTLIELMLVVLIIAISSGIAVPSFIRSYRGAKLRTSARTVIMMHRHARSMAVLGQKHIAVLFDAKKGELETVNVGGSSATESRSRFLDDRDRRTTASVDAAAATDAAAPAADLPAITTELIRPLAEGVTISRFESEKSGAEIDALYWINYYPNGMCDKFELTLRDAYGKQADVTVDNLSGKVKVEYN